MRGLFQGLIVIVSVGLAIILPMVAMSGQEKVGIAIMHGKMGSPTKYVSDLANSLGEKGYLVANIEMPWSGRRCYDANVYAAEQELHATLSSLRNQGARACFVAGHSQGCTFALHFAGRHAVDGVICIAPGGDAGSPVFAENLGESLTAARQLVNEGRGGENVQLYEVDSLQGKTPVVTTPEIYLTWFEPGGPMNMSRAARAANPQTPILWIVPERDYPSLRQLSIPLFAALPPNPQTKLYEPSTDHLGAPAASIDEIVRWVTLVRSSQGE